VPPPAAPALPPAVAQRVGWLHPEAFRPVPGRARDYTFDAHWALYVENYLEGLHIPFLHAGLAAAIGWDAYRYEGFEGGTLQWAPARAGEAAFEPPPGHPEHGQRVGAWYFWRWPNLMLNFYPWGLSLNVVEPLSPTRTRVRFRSYVREEALLGEGAGGALDTVEQEDEAAVVAVQRALRSPLYERGRFAPGHEAGVHAFQRRLVEALQGRAAPAPAA
jgi:choline monooxygenase